MARYRLKSAAVINGENKSRILVRVRQLLRRCEETDAMDDLVMQELVYSLKKELGLAHVEAVQLPNREIWFPPLSGPQRCFTIQPGWWMVVGPDAGQRLMTNDEFARLYEPIPDKGDHKP